MKLAGRREWIAVAALIAFGFGLRVIFVIAMEDYPPHQFPIMDSAYHVGWARAIAAGEQYPPLADRPYYRAPLYVWFLAGILFLFGDGLLWPRLIQCALGAASIGLVYLVGQRAFEPRAAFAAAAIAATYWLLIYFDGELLSETLVVPLALLALWLTLGLASRSSLAKASCAGFAWGLTALARPNVLLFVPLVPLWMMWIRRSMRELVSAALFGVFVLLPILPVTAYNTFVKGDFVPIASYGGINFWIGNNPQSNGIDAFLPGARSGWWEEYYDAITLAERAEGRSLRASEVSRYYSALAWNFIWSHPEQSIPHFWHKLKLVWAGEYGNNEPEKFVAHRYSWVPHLSIGYGVLAPLGLLGLALARRRAAQLFPLWGFLGAYVVSLVAFFVCSRYRVPLLPVLMIFAGHALVCLWRQWRAREVVQLAVGLTFLLGFGAWALTQGPSWTEVQTNGYFHLGTAEAARGNHREAAEHLRRATQLAPDRVDMLVRLAWSERQLGNHAAAIDHYRRAVNLAPRQSQALEGLIDLALADGRSAEVEQWIEAYLENVARRGLGRPSEVAHYYRGRIRARRGERDGARADFIEALRSDPRSSRAALALGDLARDAELWGDAQNAYQQALLALGPYTPTSDDDRAYEGLVHALQRQGRQPEACEQASAWTARRPRSRAAWAAREQCP